MTDAQTTGESVRAWSRGRMVSRLAYWFDGSLSRGGVSLIAWLALLSALLIAGAALVVFALSIPMGDETIGFVEAVWQALVRTLDAGTMADDAGWPFRVVMLAVTLGGIFLVSTLIGIITTSMNARLIELRKGRSQVLEVGHILVVGWSPAIFTLLTELATANANVRRPRVVVLADRDRVAMEDDIRSRVGERLGQMRVICRSGDPLAGADLALVSAGTARSIVVLPPVKERHDAFALKALLALTRCEHRRGGANHIVATIREQRTAEAAQLMGTDDIRLINVDDLIARIIAETCRQAGLSIVFTELLNFAGDEIYFNSDHPLDGSTYGQALLAYDDVSLIGLRTSDGKVRLNPPPDEPIATETDLIVIAADDDSLNDAAPARVMPDARAVLTVPAPRPSPERTLVLGWNHRGPGVLRRLDVDVAAGSLVEVVGCNTREDAAFDALADDFAHLELRRHDGDPREREVLESLQLDGFHHVILLADSDSIDDNDADTRTLLTLLHLRDLARQYGYAYTIVTEILDPRNRELARVEQADDFIVSDELVSLMLAQVAEQAALCEVLTELFEAEGTEIYIRPAAQYVRTGQEMNYATVVEAARRRGQTAIGYRSAETAHIVEAHYGISINPPKSRLRRWDPQDQIILLAES